MRNLGFRRRNCSRRLIAALALTTVCSFDVLLVATVQAQVSAKTLIGKAVTDQSEFAKIDSAIAQFCDRDIDGCRAIFERARASNAKLPPPGVMMSMLWLSVNQLQPARAELEDTAVRFPGDPEPYLMLGDLAFQDGRITDAAVLFDKATALAEAYTENARRKREFDIRCNAGSAAIAEARKQWRIAEKHLTTWLELDPDNASAHQRMGVVLFQLGKEQESLSQFREARKLDEKAVHPELALARLYDDARDREAAKRLIDDAVRASPADPSVLLASAQWYLGQNELAAAASLAEQAMAIDSESLEAKIVGGAVARVSRDYPTAEKLFRRAHRASPENFPASNSLALVLIESTDRAAQNQALELAEKNVARYAENSPQQTNALTTLAWVYYKKGRREEAERILDQISRNNSLTTDGAYYVARILSDRGEKDRAYQILDEVLANEPMFATRPDAVELFVDLGGTRPASDLRKVEVPDTPEAQAISKVVTQMNIVWGKANREASTYTVIVPPDVWERCMQGLLAIRVKDCPNDFREAWENYLLGSKELCDGLKRSGSVIELAAAMAKGALTAGVAAIEEVDRAGAISKAYSDAAVRLRIVAKRHGVE